PAELFVLEVHGVPGSFLAVEDIDRPRIGISGHEQKQQDRRRQLDPTSDLDVFGNFYQCGYRCLQIDAGVELHSGFNHHLSKHRSDPFRAVRPICVVLKAKTRPMAHTSADVGGNKCARGLVLLAVLGLRVGWSRKKKIAMQDDVYIKDASRTLRLITTRQWCR